MLQTSASCKRKCVLAKKYYKINTILLVYRVNSKASQQQRGKLVHNLRGVEDMDKI